MRGGAALAPSWIEESGVTELTEVDGAGPVSVADYPDWEAFTTLLFSGRAPAGLVVDGDLPLARLNLRSLPSGLEVRGELDLSGCPRLARLGENTHVFGDLRIGGRGTQRHELDVARAFAQLEERDSPLRKLRNERTVSLARLPRGLRVQKSLVVVWAPRLHALPADLEVGEDLELRSCHALATLPTALRVGRSISLRCCRSLQSLPDGLEVAGDLTLDRCRALRELPRGLVVRGTLTLDHVPIRELPDDLVVEGGIVIASCREIRRIPSFRVTGDVMLKKCPRVESLDLPITAGGSVRFRGMPALKRVAAELVVKEDVRIGGAPELVELPDNLRVPGVLEVSRCPKLPSLPAGLHVGRISQVWLAHPILVLDGSTSLRSLPADLRMRGTVSFAGTGIETIPDALVSRLRVWIERVAIPAERWLDPGGAPLDIVLEPNAEVRRVLLERAGLEDVVARAGLEVRDEDRDPGGARRLLVVRRRRLRDRLLRRDAQKGRVTHAFLHCRCPSTARSYLLRVPPGTQTCHDAAAWMAGLDPADYHPIIET